MAEAPIPNLKPSLNFGDVGAGTSTSARLFFLSFSYCSTDRNLIGLAQGFEHSKSPLLSFSEDAEFVCIDSRHCPWSWKRFWRYCIEPEMPVAVQVSCLTASRAALKCLSESVSRESFVSEVILSGGFVLFVRGS